MQNTSNPAESISNGYWLRQTHQDGIPADCRQSFYILRNKLVAYYKDLIDHVIKENGGVVKTPMDISCLEKYFSGFSFEYIPFFELFGIDGYWEMDYENDKVIIYYNTNCPEHRQRYTKVHEFFHFAQSLDMKFLEFMDSLILESDLPESVIKQLLEKSTEKATAMYLMPNDYFIKKYEETKDIDQLARIFGVSRQTLCYRIKECGLLYS